MCIDCFTRWTAAVPMTDISTETTILAFLSGWVPQFGVSATVIKIMGAQFKSHLRKKLMEFLGTTHNHVTANHPQGNGMVERFHRHLKDALKAQPHPYHWCCSPFALQQRRISKLVQQSLPSARPYDYWERSPQRVMRRMVWTGTRF